MAPGEEALGEVLVEEALGEHLGHVPPGVTGSGDADRPRGVVPVLGEGEAERGLLEFTWLEV